MRRKEKKLDKLKKISVIRIEDNVERILKEGGRIVTGKEKIKNNIVYFPLIKEEEEELLECFKNLVAEIFVKSSEFFENLTNPKIKFTRGEFILVWSKNNF